MSVSFIKHMNTPEVLLIQSFLSNEDGTSCSLICKSMQKRTEELRLDLLQGYTRRRIVTEAGRFWKSFDIDFQIKNRERWDMFAKQQLLSESKKSKYYEPHVPNN